MLCPDCGNPLKRTHRTLSEKFIYAEKFRCRKCKFQGGTLRQFVSEFMTAWTFVGSRHSRCPQCSTADVMRLPKPDRIDPRCRKFVALMQGLLGAPTNMCAKCRLQFYDFRKPKVKARAERRRTPMPESVSASQ